MIKGIENIKPKTLKSNLNIKRRKKKSNTIRKEVKKRLSKEADIMKDANIVFGLDNGATGTISCVIPYSDTDIDVFFDKTFANLENDYQHDTQKIARIDWQKLKDWFDKIIKKGKSNYIKKYGKTEQQIKIAVVLERPMINVNRFKQSKNAARAFEATLVVLEMLGLKDNYIIIDSKKWQHYLFGKNTVLMDLKLESKKAGIQYLNTINSRRFKKIKELIENHGDADSLLISKYALEKLC